MVKIVKSPGNGRLNNLNDPVLNVLTWTSLFQFTEIILTAIAQGHQITVPRYITSLRSCIMPLRLPVLAYSASHPS